MHGHGLWRILGWLRSTKIRGRVYRRVMQVLHALTKKLNSLYLAANSWQVAVGDEVQPNIIQTEEVWLLGCYKSHSQHRMPAMVVRLAHKLQPTEASTCGC